MFHATTAHYTVTPWQNMKHCENYQNETQRHKVSKCCWNVPKDLLSEGLPQNFHLQKIQYLFSSVQLLNCVRLFATPWITAHQASLSITNSWSSHKLMSIESVMPSNHLILFHPLFLLPSVFLSIRVFSNESVLRIRWPEYWSFSFSLSPSNEYSELISFRMDW